MFAQIQLHSKTTFLLNLLRPKEKEFTQDQLSNQARKCRTYNNLKDGNGYNHWEGTIYFYHMRASKLNRLAIMHGQCNHNK